MSRVTEFLSLNFSFPLGCIRQISIQDEEDEEEEEKEEEKKDKEKETLTMCRKSTL